MHIQGNNNRVASRDYYEKATLELTSEQLRELAIKPCSRCEVRFVGSEREICNHCQSQLQELAAKERLAVFGVATLVVWGLLMQLSGHQGKLPFFNFIELGIIAMVLVAFAAIVWACVKEWWLFNGDELLRSIAKAIKKRI